MSSLTFIVPGSPQGKQRPKIVKIGGFSRMATPKATVNYESLVAHTAQAAMQGRPMFDDAVGVELHIACQVPARSTRRPSRTSTTSSRRCSTA